MVNAAALTASPTRTWPAPLKLCREGGPVELKIVSFNCEEIRPGAGRFFTVEVLPEKGHLVALEGRRDRLQVKDVGFTQDGLAFVPTVWLSERVDPWDR